MSLEEYQSDPYDSGPYEEFMAQLRGIATVAAAFEARHPGVGARKPAVEPTPLDNDRPPLPPEAALTAGIAQSFGAGHVVPGQMPELGHMYQTLTDIVDAARRQEII